MMDSDQVLAVLAAEAGAGAVLRHAARAAEALSHPEITALHIRVDPLSTITTEEIMTDMRERELKEEGEREAATIFAVFEAWRGKDNENAIWEDVFGTIEPEVEKHAANATLLVIAAPRHDALGHARQAFHAALFESGRPVLAVGAHHEARPIRRIVIGWQNNELSRKAVLEAAPWLDAATHVFALHVGEDTEELVSAAQLLADLKISATTQLVAEDGLSRGERLLHEAEALKADWLVMGAYRHSRLREWMLGGVTRTVLEAAPMPLFLLHGS
jgi:nucleotide-binding universal stress UspA family protein